MFGWFKSKNQTAMEKLVEDTENELIETNKKTCKKIKLYMNSGKVLHITAYSMDEDDNQYIFDDNNRENFLMVPHRQVEYVDIGDTIRMTKDMKYLYSVIDPNEKPEYKSKRNRLKEIS